MGIVQACKGDSRKIKTLITSVADALNSIAEAFAKLDEQPEKGSKTEKSDQKVQKSDQKVQKSERKEQKSEQKPEKCPVIEPTEVKFVPIDKVIPQKPRSKEAQRAIDSIKEAHAKKRAEVLQEQKQSKRGRKSKIDDTLIVYMHDEQGKRFKDIAKEIGCSAQTASARYKKAKEEINK
jgi:hypothetical protein